VRLAPHLVYRDLPEFGDPEFRIDKAGIAHHLWFLESHILHGLIARVRNKRDVNILLDDVAVWVEVF